MTAAAMVAEFDDVAGWTADAVEELGVRYAIPAACRGSASPAALAWLAEVRTGSVDAAWCLGVLCTVEDKPALLGEIHRVLTPGASLGLLVVVARSPQGLPGPEGNHFPTQDELAGLLDRTGFTLLEQTGRPDAAPLSWSRRVEQVNAAIAARHQSARAYTLAARQGERLSRLFATGQVSMQLIHAVSRPASDTSFDSGDGSTAGPTFATAR
ncbi:methyltransferase family protein [Kribbella orskensis]|uniref:Methyltransferase family protein n=1 Tax=Kribbella orskensis TaxID=2512216 RepID=A0ABY2BN94_9ACTN|nr:MULTISPECIES: methyltransferase domain-containing protein [Kribbella]TCN41840.1 methyltransferase family protein [Kribbella sp. VKM Ac-2500]TCO25718.1 methyltransferase family protein [Kribbella orskensis]